MVQITEIFDGIGLCNMGSNFLEIFRNNLKSENRQFSFHIMRFIILIFAQQRKHTECTLMIFYNEIHYWHHFHGLFPYNILLLLLRTNIHKSKCPSKFTTTLFRPTKMFSICSNNARAHARPLLICIYQSSSNKQHNFERERFPERALIMERKSSPREELIFSMLCLRSFICALRAS